MVNETECKHNYFICTFVRDCAKAIHQILHIFKCTHPDLVVSLHLCLYNTAPATPPATAAVSRMPPMKLAMAPPTPTPTQVQACTVRQERHSKNDICTNCKYIRNRQIPKNKQKYNYAEIMLYQLKIY